jgi:hypothetical protein
MLLFLLVQCIVYTKPFKKSSYKKKMSFNNTVMSIEKFNYADAQAKAHASNPNSGMNNLDIYIPRIDGRYTEEDIKFSFRAFGVGIVDYVDFVSTKDVETKEIKFYSAFIRLVEWNIAGIWYKQMIREKQTRVQISRSEYWIILQSKTPLARSKVNTHQLAAYTDELFQTVENQAKQIENQQSTIDRQSRQIDFLMSRLEEESAKIREIKNHLKEKDDDTFRSSDDSQLNCEFCDKLFDTETKLKNHEQICSESWLPPVQQKEEKYVFFTPPQRWKPLNPAAESLMKKSSSDIMSGTFTYDLHDVSKELNMSENEIIKAFNDAQEKEKRTTSPENSQRVKTSNIICGNL